MKKNVMMRIASVLMICVLISTCGISGTFAKYVTKGEATDSARVAKWGVNVEAITAETNTLFKNEYGTSVKADVAVVAPGTDGTMANFNITGSPEVAAKVRYAATVELDGWVIGGEFYCPIVFSINGTPIDTSACTTVDAYEKAIVDAIKAHNGGSYAIGETIGSNFTLSWEWPFEVNDANDTKDTILGTYPTGNTISVKVDCIVEQID